MRDGDKRIVRLKEGTARGRHVVIVDDLVQSGGWGLPASLAPSESPLCGADRETFLGMAWDGTAASGRVLARMHAGAAAGSFTAPQQRKCEPQVRKLLDDRRPPPPLRPSPGGTLIECQRLLATQGAAHVSAYVTHGVFPNESWRRFEGEGSNGATDGFKCVLALGGRVCGCLRVSGWRLCVRACVLGTGTSEQAWRSHVPACLPACLPACPPSRTRASCWRL